ncbi:Phosphoribosylaminoimidazole-succinocarboxamide synthase [Lecanosticta acicola]|uniref:Phosphoribosylaminoimidazole-succinocarboxamide synthase n=1 Tax=Lecanosticta acicola TaxID=111012 RepID=A0AAI8W1D5_9PEZI|nr:Phosphoribosylaminoimidazole-succinocarboxamide synthase [Lecanosticta acicola]
MVATERVITKVEIPNYRKIASGKVREIFEVDAGTLLFIATDRISAYDVVMENGVPGKGSLLTQMSCFWFRLIAEEFPNLKTHIFAMHLPSGLAPAVQAPLKERSMQVKRTPVIPLESIVRGYITGSAWSEYKAKGTVHGMPMPEGLRESQKLEQAIWTPSTKAEQGEHDENISKAQAVEIVGEEVAGKIEKISLELYEMARDFADARGIIIADTKFEFGLDPKTKDIVLIDEVLTPDSSRFWPKDQYEVGRSQSSYDKQYLRDWLTSSGLKGKPGVSMPEEVVKETASKYQEAYEKLTGKKWA